MLSSLTTVVLASNGESTGANPIAGLLPFLLIGVVFYFLIIRPQKKRQQEQQAMVRSVDVGDEIVTIGGFHGDVVGLSDDTMQVELAPGVVVTIARNAISRRVSDTEAVDLDDDFDDDPAYDDPAHDDPAFDDPEPDGMAGDGFVVDDDGVDGGADRNADER